MNRETELVASRELAIAFAFAHGLFRAPSIEQHDWLMTEAVQSAWTELADSLGLSQMRLEVPSTYEDYAQRFIATFDVGTPNPPVPLIESHYNKRDPIPRILHENILFYRQFGLQLRDSALESADHLRHQLEFVRHLLEYRAQLERDKKVAGAGQSTEALVDFAKRHLLSWLPEAIACAEGVPLAFARPALALAHALARRVAGSDDFDSNSCRETQLKEARSCSG